MRPAPDPEDPLFHINVSLLSSTRIVTVGDRRLMEFSTWTADRGPVGVRRG